MSLTEMQGCLARLYTDFAFQQLFFLDPTFTLNEYDLSGAELEALTGLNRTRLKRFAVSLMNKSLDKFENGFPLLFKAAGPQINRYFPRFYHLFPSHREEPQLLEFGSFMEQTLKADPELPPYLSELACYERQIIIAELGAESQLALLSRGDSSNSLECHPVLAPGVNYAHYRHNIVALAQAIQQDQPIAESETGSFIFLVYLSPGKAQPQILELNQATCHLIQCCNSVLSVGEIIERLEQFFERTGLKEMVNRNIEKLSKLGVLNA